MNENVKRWDQYPTPAWAAAALVRLHYRDLSSADVVFDPTCGQGRFLAEIPDDVRAYGWEIDPVLAQEARDLTNREVITGDFLTAVVPERPTVLIGNPPFKMAFVDRLLDRAHELLPDEGRVGLILPAYAFQTASAVVRYSEWWSLAQELIPRNIYPGLSKPLVFAMFRKDQRKLLVGFSLYHETAFVRALPPELALALEEGPVTWSTVVLQAVQQLGGAAYLHEIYEFVASRRPTENPAWREQVRKICGSRLRRLKKAQYALPGGIAA